MTRKGLHQRVWVVMVTSLAKSTSWRFRLHIACCKASSPDFKRGFVGGAVAEVLPVAPES